MDCPTTIPTKSIINKDFVCSISLIDCNVVIAEYASYNISVKVKYNHSGN